MKRLTTLLVLTLSQGALAKGPNCNDIFTSLKTTIKASALASFNLHKSNFMESKGLSLTGRLPLPKEHRSEGDEIMFGLFAVHHPEPGATFMDAPFKNSAQFLPRTVGSRLLPLVTRVRHAPGTKFNFEGVSGLYRHFSRILLSTAPFESTKFYEKDILPYWYTAFALNWATPLGMYFAYFDPLGWFIAGDEKINEMSEDWKFDKLLEWDPRFQDLNTIPDISKRRQFAKKRLVEIEYFRGRLLGIATQSQFFIEPSRSDYRYAARLLTMDLAHRPSRAQLPAQVRNILDRFETIAGWNESDFIQKISDSLDTISNSKETMLAPAMVVTLRARSSEGLCKLSCTDESSLAMFDTLIRAQVRGYMKMIALDGLLFSKSRASLQVQQSPVLKALKSELEVDARVMSVVNKRGVDVYEKRGILGQFLEFQSRKQMLSAIDLSYVVPMSRGTEIPLLDGVALGAILKNFGQDPGEFR
jgi:hypothetical protein